MRVLVTGASGMLGAATARALAERGDAVTLMQRRPGGLGLAERLGDITDERAVRAAVAGQDAVVHLAAKVDVLGRATDFEAVNIGGTARLVAACRAEGVGRLVHVSSPSVAHAGSSLVGVGAAPADPRRARGHYARTKARAEQIALAADASPGSGLAVLAVRPHLVWGPGDTQLVARIAARARAGRLPIIGSGAPLVDTTYVDNAADALVAALDALPGARGEAYVVTNGEPRPIGEILARIALAAGARPPRTRIPVALAAAAGGLAEGVVAARARVPGLGLPADPPLTRFLVEQLTTAHWFDQRRTRERLGWAPRVGLDEGFRRLAAHGGEIRPR